MISDAPTPRIPNRVAGGVTATLGALLAFSMLFAPAAYQPVKAGLLLLVLIGVLLNWRTQPWMRLHRSVFALATVSVGFGLLSSLWGALNATPGAAAVLTVAVLWPAVMSLVAAGVQGPVLEKLVRVMLWATLAISVYILVVVLAMMKMLPSVFLLDIGLGQRSSINTGWVQFRINSITTLVFTIPFLIAAVLSWKDVRTLGPRWFVYTVLIVAVVASLVTMRRGLWIAIMIAPISTMVLCLFAARSDGVRPFGPVGVRVVAVGIAMAVALGAFATVTKLDLALAFQNLTDVVTTARSDERSEQFGVLMNAWERTPLFGAGAGAGVANYVRAEEAPWAFELSYVAMLYQNGLIGVAIYAFSFLWVLGMGLRILREGHPLGPIVLGLTVGAISFLIANATNPYLAKFDSMWVIFLPVAVVNAWLLEKQREPALSGELRSTPAG